MARSRAPFLILFLILCMAGCGGTDLALSPEGTTVTVSPQVVTLQPGGTTAFNASVTGNKNQGVTWSVVGGTANGNFTGATGLFTAPKIAGTYTVVATSVADTGKAGSATVLVAQPPSVTISPGTATLLPGESQLFTASISNSTNQTVTWSVLGGSSSGSFSGTTGLYTAPSRPGSYTVLATAVSDTSLSASATVTVNGPVLVGVNPNSVSLLPGGTQLFTANVSGITPTTVDWNVVEAGGGTIDFTTGVYVAPSSSGTFTVKATSRANGTSSGTARVTVSPSSVGLFITPSAATLDQGAAQLFTPTVTGTYNPLVAWSVNGGTATTLAGPFLYTAPATAGTYLLRATPAAASTILATATIIVRPVAVATLSPSAAVVPTGGTLPFTTAVTGSVNTAIAWSVLAGGSGGSINASGLYTAPTKTGTDTVVATASADAKASNFALVTVGKVVIAPAAPSPVAAASGRISFSAVVTGVDDANLVWKILPLDNDGSITSSGFFFAPSLPGIYRVRATSTVNSALFAEVPVTVTGPILVSVSPSPVTLPPGGTQVFTAAVSGATSNTVVWSVLEPGGGTIDSATGVYTAPTTAGNYTVKATLKADGLSFGTASVLVSAVEISVAPSSVTLDQGASQLFTPTLVGTTNKAIAWSVNGGTATTQSGPFLYTAPTTAGTYLLRAVPSAGPGVQATAVITVKPVLVTNMLQSATVVPTGGTVAFSANVTGSTNSAITWSVLQGGAGGAINASGIYTAPAMTGTDTVVATAAADSKVTLSANVTVGKITLSPAAPSAVPATTGRITFSATVAGLADSGVNWSILPTPNDGSITPGGVFSAPSLQGVYWVRAASKISPTLFGEVQVTVSGPVTIQVSPNPVTLAPRSSQTFTAAISGTTATTVAWSVVEPGGGSIDAGTGLYTAPSTFGNFTVKATLKVNNNEVGFGTAMVMVSAVNLRIDPPTWVIDQGASKLFTPLLTGTSNPMVMWSVNGGAATTQSGPFLYIAPTSAGTYLLRGVPAADPLVVPATAVITVNAVTMGAIQPPGAAFPPGGNYFVSFSSLVTGTTHTGVTWSVAEGAAGGTINDFGVYTSPMTAGTYTIIATSVADGTVTKFALVTVGNITISPESNSVPASTGHITFSALVAGVIDPATGKADPEVLWSILPTPPDGSITSAGYFTAPTLPGVYRVRAASKVNSFLFNEVLVTVY